MKVQLTWFGKAAGRSAGTIYQSYYGNTYTRAMPFSFHYPDTKKQQETQASFFDIQRNWFPIYNQIKLNIKMQQRYDKNVFNRLSQSTYRIMNPYAKKAYKEPQRYFGLDERNENRPTINALNVDFKEETIRVYFDMNRPYWNRSEQITNCHLLLFNRDKQTMMYQQNDFHAGLTEFVLQNTMDWQETDEILIYLAIASNNYLANFNLIN
jgi:hypothetical protein